MKKIVILGGGTVNRISPHFVVSAPARGTLANKLAAEARKQLSDKGLKMDISVLLTQMAGGSDTLVTNEDLSRKADELVADPNVKIVFFTCAVADWTPTRLIDPNGNEVTAFGYDQPRLKTSGPITIDFRPADKIVGKIRKERKDIFLIACKATSGATNQQMFEAGLGLLKSSHVNLALVNDVQRRLSMIVTPEEAAYHETGDRDELVTNLVDMALLRSQLTFTQSTVISGEPVNWSSPEIPESIRTVVDHCITAGAYKPFAGATVGHFAIKLKDDEFLTSIRRSNFVDLAKTGMVRVKTDGPDTVLAYGAKPSVGGQSQRQVFRDHEGYDCIVHFHCPLKDVNQTDIPIRSQREVECGSHQCGKNTSDGLKLFPEYGNLKAVMLDQHGPNIVFNRDIDPRQVIAFIAKYFDLAGKTGGYQLPKP